MHRHRGRPPARNRTTEFQPDLDRVLAGRLERAARLLDTSPIPTLQGVEATPISAHGNVVPLHWREARLPLEHARSFRTEPGQQRRNVRLRALVAFAPMASVVTVLVVGASTESVAAASPATAPPAVTTALAEPALARRKFDDAPASAFRGATASTPSTPTETTIEPTTVPTTVPTAKPPRTAATTQAAPWTGDNP